MQLRITSRAHQYQRSGSTRHDPITADQRSLPDLFWLAYRPPHTSSHLSSQFANSSTQIISLNMHPGRAARSQPKLYSKPTAPLVTAGRDPVQPSVQIPIGARGAAISLRHRRRTTSRRDFVPWRFSAAGRRSAWLDRRCRQPKTCTNADSSTATPGQKISVTLCPIERPRTADSCA